MELFNNVNKLASPHQFLSHHLGKAAKVSSFAIFIVLLFIPFVKATTLDVDTTWSTGDQYFTETVTVSSGVTLTIEAGAALHFESNNKLLINDGAKLFVQGTAISPVILTSDSAIQSGWWGIEVAGERADSNDIQIDYAVIEYAKYGVTYLQGSKGDITNSQLKDSTRGVFFNGKRTGGLISNTSLFDNQYGVYISGSYGYLVDHPTPVVNNNNFSNNSSYHYYANYFYDNTKVILDARNNWWGTTDLTSIVADIYDQANNINYAPGVDFNGVLDSENGSPISNTLYTSPIISDTTWDSQNAIIVQPINVHAGNTLTVVAGSYIEGAAGSQLIIKDGANLLINGVLANPVTLTGTVKTKTGWKGVQVEGARADNTSIQVDYAIIEHATDAIKFNPGSRGQIYNSILRNNTQGIHFSGKKTGGLVSGSQLYDNTYGIKIYGAYGYVADHPSPIVNNNSIYNNSGYDFHVSAYYNNTQTIVNAKNNWWGSSNTATISSNIYDYVDSASYSPSVDFSGFLDNENGASVAGTFYINVINTNTTWSSNDGQLVQPITIQSGATLTINAGTQVTAAPGSQIIVNDGAKLIIAGSETEPVVFNGANPTKNGWKGIKIKGERVDSLDVQINHAVIEHATDGVFFDTGSKGDIRNSVIKNNTQGIHFFGKRSGGLVTQNEIFDNTYGIKVYGAYSYFNDHPTPVVIQNSIYNNSSYNYYANSFYDNGSRILDANHNWWGSADLYTIASKIYNFADAHNYAPSVDFSSPLVSANGAVLAGTLYLNAVHENITWDAVDGLLVQPVTVLSGATLTIDAGTHLTAIQNTEIVVNPGASLVISGSQISPVTLNGDSPVKSRWKGIKIKGERADSTAVQIDYAVIEHATNGVLFETGSKGDIRNSLLKNNTQGVNFNGKRTGGLIEQNTITDNTYGVKIYATYGYLNDHPAPIVRQNSLYNNSGYNYYANSFYDNDLATLDATGNWWGSSDIEVVVAGIYDHNDYAYYAPHVDFRGFLVSEGGIAVPGIQVLGNIANQERWQNSHVKVVGNTWIKSGASLSIGAGSQLDFSPNAQLIVEKGGSLTIFGEVNNPVILTSDRLAPVAGDWKGIKIEAENTDLKISHTIIKFADKGLYFYGKRATGVVTNSRIVNNTYGVYVDGVNTALADHPTPLLTQNEFSGNTAYNYYSKSFASAASRTLNAKGNAWGSLDDTTIHTSIYDNRDTSSSPTVDTGSPVSVGETLVTANAGNDIVAFGTIPVNLTGSGTSTAGSIDTYQWQQYFGEEVILNQADQATANFTADDVQTEDTRSFILTVTDDNDMAASDMVDVIVRPLSEFNQPPVVPADALQIIESNGNANIVMTSTDPDGDMLTYLWSQTKGTLVSITDVNSDILGFTAQTAVDDEVLSFQLTVSDGIYTITRDVTIGVRQKVTADGVYYYHNDHLGTPQVMTDETATIVWQASYTPFGKATIAVNTIDNNIRFPGQYFDAETGLHYNYFRDYDPEIGRYIQSDPIGLAGGINTYGYVGGNPVNAIDPRGLDCTSSNNITTCIPVDTSFDPVTFPTPGGWDDFEAGDFNFHDYLFIHDLGSGNGCGDYGNRLRNELMNSPTNDTNSASQNGTLNDVGPLHPFSGVDNVLSYSTNQGVLNVTLANHAVGSGFVMRRIAPNGRGGFQIMTYGEGDSWKQIMPGADGLAESFWAANAQLIQQRANGEGCDCN